MLGGPSEYSGIKLTMNLIGSGKFETSTGVILCSKTHQHSIVQGAGTIRIGGSSTNPTDTTIYDGAETSISCGSDGTGSGSITICGKAGTISVDVSVPMETAFKNGWNAAIAAVESAIGQSVSTSASPGASNSQSATITVTGGDGKNSLSKTVSLSLTNSSGAETNCTNGGATGGGWYKATTSTDPDRVWCYTGSSSGTHNAIATGSASAQVTIS